MSVEGKEPYLEDNIRIVNQMKKVIEGKDPEVWDNLNNFIFIKGDPKEPILRVEISVSITESREPDLYGDTMYVGLPDEFKAPFYGFHDWRPKELGPRYSFENRVFSAGIIGADERLYWIENDYFFDEEGHGKKKEGIYRFGSRGSLEKDLEYWGLKNEFYRVDFVPQDGSIRWEEFEAGDYEKILGILDQIKRGELQFTSFTPE